MPRRSQRLANKMNSCITDSDNTCFESSKRFRENYRDIIKEDIDLFLNYIEKSHKDINISLNINESNEDFNTETVESNTMESEMNSVQNTEDITDDEEYIPDEDDSYVPSPEDDRMEYDFIVCNLNDEDNEQEQTQSVVSSRRHRISKPTNHRYPTRFRLRNH
jgi:hypothetical protein